MSDRPLTRQFEDPPIRPPRKLDWGEPGQWVRAGRSPDGGGAVGYVSYSGNMDVAIAIRTLVTVGDSIYVQSGGGVVHDSSPDGEFEESLNKARGVLRAVSMARHGQQPGRE